MKKPIVRPTQGDRRSASDSSTGMKKARPIVLPSALAEVALVDARTAAATGGMSESWWTDRVRTGIAPKPAVRLPRFTRWRVADVVEFWRALPEQTAGSDLTVQIATRASRARLIKR